jgi:DNA replicative helicase MCM subunit Mcm2 (Cdc46/Mcm family)
MEIPVDPIFDETRKTPYGPQHQEDIEFFFNHLDSRNVDPKEKRILIPVEELEENIKSRLLTNEFRYMLASANTSYGRLAEQAGYDSSEPRHVGFTMEKPSHTLSNIGTIFDTLMCVEGRISDVGCRKVAPWNVKYVAGADRNGRVSTFLIRKIGDPHDIPLKHHHKMITKIGEEPVTYLAGSSRFVDYLTLGIKDDFDVGCGKPERLEVLLEDDLARMSFILGSKIRVHGMSMAVPGPGYNAMNFRKIFFACHVSPVKESMASVVKYHDHEIINLVKRPDFLSIISRSFLPKHSGDPLLKFLCFAQLVSTIKKWKTYHVRKSINVLVVSLYGMGKSEIIKWIIKNFSSKMNIGSTTAYGSSTVGYTVSMEMEKNGDGYYIVPGACVTLDRGILYIDEFDKPRKDENDIMILNSVLDFGMVYVCKAGVHSQFNARCAIFAAANPRVGSPKKHPFPKEFTDRFDVVYVMENNSSREHDENLCYRWLKNHGGNDREFYGVKIGDRIEMIGIDILHQLLDIYENFDEPMISDEAIETFNLEASQIDPLLFTYNYFHSMMRFAVIISIMKLEKIITREIAETAADIVKASLGLIKNDEVRYI